MLKFKKLREYFDGFPARCAGCLLALIIFITPCTFVYAAEMSFTDSTYPFDSSILPDTHSLYFQSAQLNHNIFLLYDPTDQTFIYLSLADYYTNTADSYQFIFDGNYIYNWQRMALNGRWATFGVKDSTVISYKIGGAYHDWTVYNFMQSVDNYGDYGYQRFNVQNLYLIAAHMNSHIEGTLPNSDVVQELFVYVDNGALTYGSAECKFYFDSDGYLTDVSGGGSSSDNPDYSGPLSTIIGWLEDVYDTISGLVSNLWTNYLSQPISTIVNALSNIGTTIWDAIKAPFQGPVHNPPNGGIIYRLWNDLSAGFTFITDWLSDFLDDVWNDFIYGLEEFWTDIRSFDTAVDIWLDDFFDNIVSLILPSDEYLEEYRDDVIEACELRFGALWQTLSLSEDLLNAISGLFDYTRGNNLTIWFPEIAFNIQGTRYVFFEKLRTQMNTYFTFYTQPITYQTGSGTNSITFRTFIDGFINAMFLLLLFYNLKNQLNRILSNSFNVGDD